MITKLQEAVALKLTICYYYLYHGFPSHSCHFTDVNVSLFSREVTVIIINCYQNYFPLVL